MKAFVTEKGGKFPLMAKSDVNGENTNETYSFLRTTCGDLYDSKSKKAKQIPWNFAKFLVNSEGQVVSYHGPQESPLSFEDKIKQML